MYLFFELDVWVSAHVWWSEDNRQESVLSSTTRVPGLELLPTEIAPQTTMHYKVDLFLLFLSY